jgi:hypothetical protein
MGEKPTTSSETVVAVRSSKSTARTFRSIRKDCTRRAVFKALLKVHKEYPHLIDNHL